MDNLIVSSVNRLKLKKIMATWMWHEERFLLALYYCKDFITAPYVTPSRALRECPPPRGKATISNLEILDHSFLCPDYDPDYSQSSIGSMLDQHS